MLTIQDLSFGYTKEEYVLQGITVTIKKGEFVAIGGRNGSGKTTLTRLIMGLEKPLSGHIYFQEKEITQWTVAARSPYIGYVFQQPDRQMFCPTVEEEIAFGPTQLGYSTKEVQAITKHIMEKVGLTAYAKDYPLELRRGIKQRIAIASALAMNASLLILDEPTSGQDREDTEHLLQLLSVLNKEGLTILLITHNMDSIAAYCSRALIMNKGTIGYDGSPKDLFTAPTTLAQLGLVQPEAIRISSKLEGIPYCATIEELEESLLQKGGR